MTVLPIRCVSESSFDFRRVQVVKSHPSQGQANFLATRKLSNLSTTYSESGAYPLGWRRMVSPFLLIADNGPQISQGSALSFCYNNNDVQYAKTPDDDDLVGKTHPIKIFRRSVGSFPLPFVVVVVIWKLSVPHVDRIVVIISNWFSDGDQTMRERTSSWRGDDGIGGMKRREPIAQIGNMLD